MYIGSAHSPKSEKLKPTLGAHIAHRLYDLAHEGPSNFRPAKESTLHYRLLVSGLIGVWVFWVKNDCSPKKEVLAKELREDLIGFYNNMYRLYGRP